MKEEEYILITDNDGISIIGPQGLCVWSMDNHLLRQSLDINGEKLSKWILHLEEKNWVDIELLYKIAKYIQDNCSNNEIDWHSTFIGIEKRNYISVAFELKKRLENKKNNTTETVVQEFIFGMNDDHEKANKEIDKIVKQKFQEYKIL